ncbi:MAG: 2-C-methyl-D-erythritol 4-phosphate cytidylyltransferase [Alphaproteobacteria bacterium]|nr:MAG: 2-C-methyl-D-erythritol 4-phosphate cytidylyltransferase [Alphaproteobacteria bacterium]
MNPTIAIIIVAGGTGTRYDAHLPKQYHVLAGKTVLEHTMYYAHHTLPDARMVLVTHPKHHDYYAPLALPEHIRIDGGATRQASVYAGLCALVHNPPEFILIHDAARPFLTHAVVHRLLQGVQHHHAVIPVLPLVDTIKRIDADACVMTTEDRRQLVAVQTPQAFHYATIKALHDHALHHNATDDAALCEAQGIKVATIAGDSALFKITTQEDMQRAQQHLTPSYPTLRMGMGYDVHRLIAYDDNVPIEARTFILGGVKIPHTHYLSGHSDADVLLHALTDAILGAACAGDIGEHFPPSNPVFAGMDSRIFVHEAMRQLSMRGGKIVHADMTILCEAPKITPHKAAMNEGIAQMLGIATSCVNVKATTTEGLGFEGRREGIAAHAVVSAIFDGGAKN